MGARHTMKLILLSILMLLICGRTAHAQVAPQIYISNVLVPGKTFESGQTVPVAFIFTNAENTTLTNIVYKIALVGDFDKGGLPKAVYGEVTSDLLTFAPQEKKQLNFKYILPAGISGEKMGIRVRGYTESGIPLNWALTYVNVTGGVSQVTVAGASIAVGTSTFKITEGPTISAGQNIMLRVALTNSTKENLTLIPHLKIFDRVVNTKALADYADASTTLKAGMKKTISVILPVFDYKAGVYAGIIEFLDASDKPRTQPLEFRYVVAGDIATIQSLTSDRTQAKKKEPITIMVAYSGSPNNIVTGTSTHVGSVALSVKLFNERDEIVGDATKTIDLTIPQGKTDLTIASLYNAEALRAEATITKSSEVLATYSANLSADYDAKKAEAKKQTKTSQQPWLKLMLISIIVLVVLGIIIWIIRRIIQGRTPPRAPIFRIIIAALIITGFSAATHTARAAWYVTNSGGSTENAYGEPPEAFIPIVSSTDPLFDAGNGMSKSATMTSGQVFSISGTAVMQQCLNLPSHVGYEFTRIYGNSEWNQTSSHPYLSPEYYDSRPANTDSANGVYKTSTDDFNSANFSTGSLTFTAPTTPGTYIIGVRINNYHDDYSHTRNFNYGFVEGYVKFTVVEEGVNPPTLALNFCWGDNPYTIQSDPDNDPRICWGVENVQSCTAYNPHGLWNGPKPFEDTSYWDYVHNVTQQEDFGMTCTGVGGTVHASTTLYINTASPPTLTLSASPNPVKYGQSTTLTWNSTGVESFDHNDPPNYNCTASDGWSGGKDVSGKESTGNLTSQQTYALECVGIKESSAVSRSVTVNVIPSIKLITVDPSTGKQIPPTVNSGNTATLHWETKNATSCALPPGYPSRTDWNNGIVNPQKGTTTTNALTADSAFSLRCTGFGVNNTASTTRTVFVNGAPGTPTVSLTAKVDGIGASSHAITINQDPGLTHYATLIWTTSNVTSCTASGSWSGSKNLPADNENQTGLSPQATPYTYTLQCTNGSQNVSDQVTVMVNQAPANDLSCRAEDPTTGELAQSPWPVGKQMRWRATAGSGYTWHGPGSGPAGNLEGSTASSVAVIYTTVGQKDVKLQNGSGIASCSDPIFTVTAGPGYSEF
jgi:hypothetical protein